jgi:CRP/FNR family transcriptional regulator, cyclic AMP receptor protein
MQAGKVERSPSPGVNAPTSGNWSSDPAGLDGTLSFRSGGEELDASTAASLLGRVEPFRTLDEGARLAMVEHATRRVVDKGQMVFWQDEPGEAMFVLLEGSVKLVTVSRDGELIELHRHLAPAVFGELALLDGGPRTASAQAVERSVLLVVTRPELLRLLRNDDQVAEALLRILGAMVRRTTRQVSDLAFLSLQGRVAAKLLDLTEPGRTMTRRITQVELATMVGGARQTVNQALRSLEARGYIRSNGRVFEILDRDQLRRLAGG